MSQLFRVMLDLWLETLHRRWVLALFGGTTLVLAVIAASLQLDAVDGAIAGSRLFGKLLSSDIVSTDRALAPVYRAFVYLSVYVGGLALAASLSDVAPELLAPGRIEHLLSLPVARWQLLFGTYVGVALLGLAGSLYGGFGLLVVLGVKTGEWNWQLLLGAALGWLGFCVLYAAMVCAAFFVRSAAAATFAALGMLVLGLLASAREGFAQLFDEGVTRTVVQWALVPFPRLATLADAAADFAAGQRLDVAATVTLCAGSGLFIAALLGVAAYRFEQQDF